MRPGWDTYFLRIASVVASRATCPRKRVGALIVASRRILTAGYNGSLSGQPHCDNVGCLMEDGHCVRTLHAESNALLQAAQTSVNISGATIYVTASPCYLCFKQIVGAGLKRIVFGEMYRDARIRELAQEADLELADMSDRKSAWQVEFAEFADV